MISLKTLPNPVIDHAALVSLLGDYARPNDKISELIAQKEIVALKRGLYAIADSPSVPLPLVANHLHGPSYVSRHWALSYYGLLSEQVTVITSMCLGRSRQFDTPLGRFDYQAIPPAYYALGINSIHQDNIAFMMATAEKALADLLVSTRKLRIQSTRAMMTYLLDDLRMDGDELQKMDAACFYDFAKQGYKVNMLTHLGDTIKHLKRAG